MDERKVKTDWERRGFSFGIWIDLPGQIREDYVHDGLTCCSIKPAAPN
jgi:hypothetical protein